VTLQSLELSDANILVWVEGAKGVRIGGDRRTQGVRNNVVGNTLSDNAGYGLKVLRRPQGRIAANTFARNRRGRTNQRP
jgi:parallel beta-helix repeat protein